MTAFYPKLPFRACKKCFVLYHDEAKCKEIQLRIFVRALPAPTPRATHVTVTNVKSQAERGESSKTKISASEPLIRDHSRPSAFSVSLQPLGSIGNRNSTFSPLFFPSALPAVSALTIREPLNPHIPANSSRVSSCFVSPFDNFSSGDNGNVHDRKGKRPRIVFESVYLEASSFSSSSAMMPTPCWPPLSSAPAFSPPADSSFNIGSLGSQSSMSYVVSNVCWATSCSTFSQTVVPSSSYACSSVSEMNLFTDGFIPPSFEHELLSVPSQTEDFKDAIILEPLPLASLPPEPVITDEEFEREVDLMMMDDDSMAEDPSTAHDPENVQHKSYS
ncbi:uncharacterized protein LOC113285751 isoform X2 [Papaver somniferum]|uniref:uncharacterized protein LOC113285751 isoform X2 n=1 Tax=Papaver somniferum TaxID=3469 RepID=UPI000E704582|nr:uncharacterized protein LOC113285751 isoform X2 [Papaver somniferum]